VIDYIVVGAGIAGSAFTRMARREGKTVLLIDQGGPMASRAALSVMRLGWSPAGRERLLAERSLSWYGENGWIRARQAEVSSAKHPVALLQPDYFLIAPLGPLVQPDITDSVRSAEEGRIQTHRVGTYESRFVVLATGAASGFWTAGLEDRFTWGHTAYSATAQVNSPRETGFRIHHLRPYRDIVVARRVGGSGAVIGSSSATSEGRSVAELEGYIKEMERLEVISRVNDWECVGGVRAFQGEKMYGRPRWIDRRTILFSGFGRMGYTYAPWRALSLVRMLA
jgi:glycine/D-amino acid oxidase-like deaminating enzyme